LSFITRLPKRRDMERNMKRERPRSSVEITTNVVSTTREAEPEATCVVIEAT